LAPLRGTNTSHIGSSLASWTKFISSPVLSGGSPLPMDFTRWGYWSYKDERGNSFNLSFSATSDAVSIEASAICP
jgi:hypothetical protein